MTTIFECNRHFQLTENVVSRRGAASSCGQYEKLVLHTVVGVLQDHESTIVLLSVEFIMRSMDLVTLQVEHSASFS